MTQIVFVPGLFGCEMIDAQARTIWPPGKVSEPIDTQTLVQLLLDPSTRFGQIIDHVPFPCSVEVYGPVLTLLRARGNLTAFAYDWRTDVRDAAAELARTLAALPAGQDIQLVSHSMGGLVVRWLLESGNFSGAAWFSRVKLAVFAAVPHLGAPLALFRILGQDPTVPIILPIWATVALSGDPARWPSGYQLLPPSGIDCVLLANNTRQDIEEVFATRLLPLGLSKMQAVQTVLERFARPDGTSYVLAYGRGSSQTVSGARLAADGGAHEEFGDGDGTVPTWSAEPTGSLAAAAPAFDDVAAFVADHVGLVGNRLFLQRLTQWLDGAATA